jgi:signal peptidase I
MFFRSPNPDDDGSAERAPEAAPLPVGGAPGYPPDAYALFEPHPGQRHSALGRGRRLAWELAQTVVLAAAIFIAVRAMAQNFRVEGSSMEPGLHDGQYLLVNKFIYARINLKTLDKYVPFLHPGDQPVRFLLRAPHRGDVIVFRAPPDPTRDYIKRVIAVPGDEVEVAAGTVYVNGAALDEAYILAKPNYTYDRQVVPPGQYFVLGDNRNGSNDSHYWGFVPEANIIGQASLRYWPLSSFGGAGNHSIDLGFVHVPVP